MKSIVKLTALFFLAKVLFLGVFSVTAFAEEKPIKEGALFQGATFKGLVVETVYTLKVAQYKPPFLIKFVASRTNASYATPEDAMIANFSSMTAKDYVWNNETWTAASIVDNLARDKAANRTGEDWIKRWERTYIGRQVELVNRVEYAKYVLIEYRLLPRNSADKPFQDTVALVKENGQWKLTQELAADPVLANWNSPTGRVQITPNTLFNK